MELGQVWPQAPRKDPQAPASVNTKHRVIAKSFFWGGGLFYSPADAQFYTQELLL